MASQRRPQPEDHSARLEEGDLIVRLLGAAPTERLVERQSATEIADAERDETDPLFHRPSMWAPVKIASVR
jgi:hypothetical protein